MKVVEGDGMGLKVDDNTVNGTLSNVAVCNLNEVSWMPPELITVFNIFK